MELLGMPVQRERNYLISDMLPDGLEKLVDDNEEAIKSACASYAKPPNAGTTSNPVSLIFQFARPVLKRTVHLMRWVKDRDRLNDMIKFYNGVTREDFMYDLQEASSRFECSKNQKKVR